MGNRPVFGIIGNQESIICVNTQLIVTPDTEAFQSLFATGNAFIIEPTALHINGAIIAGIDALSVGIITELFFEALLEMLV